MTKHNFETCYCNPSALTHVRCLFQKNIVRERCPSGIDLPSLQMCKFTWMTMTGLNVRFNLREMLPSFRKRIDDSNFENTYFLSHDSIMAFVNSHFLV